MERPMKASLPYLNYVIDTIERELHIKTEVEQRIMNEIMELEHMLDFYQKEKEKLTRGQ